MASTGAPIAPPPCGYALGRYLVVSAGHGENVAGDRPAQVPDDVVELVQQLRRPVVTGGGYVHRPDEHLTVLPSKHTHTLTTRAQHTD